MSFQDFSSDRRNRPNAAVRPAGTSNTRVAQAPLSGGSAGGRNSLNQISETLLQYQRNVGILEKIVQSYTAAARGGRYNQPREEMIMQYKAQVGVLDELEQKVRRALQAVKSSSSSSTASNNNEMLHFSKLERDFERVQSRAKALQDGVDRALRDQEQRQRQQQSKSAAAAAASGGQQHQQQQQQFDHYQQVQMQLQQDRLNEEIMREREAEIREINRGMHQVNEIYKDLAHIVGSQQEQIDNIEQGMEESRANAEAGLQQVEKANDAFGSSSQCAIS